MCCDLLEKMSHLISSCSQEICSHIGQRVLANWDFAVTGDKYLTYRAVEMAADLLTPFSTSPIQFWRTVCEKVEPQRAVWCESERNFDIRVYVARDGDQLLPVGAIFRFALELHIGDDRKHALVVNLSGYGGVDTERGFGVSAETLAVACLEEQDLVRMFAAATVLLSYIAANHEAIQA